MKPTKSLSKTASWVIVNKKTGNAVLETYQKSVAKKINTKKYKAIPILKYLQSLNKNPLVDHLKRYAKRGAALGLNKLNTYAQSKLKNPRTRATASLFDTLRYDPYIYQRVYTPAAHALLAEWKAGRFNRMQWVRKFRTVAEHVARTLTRSTGKIVTRPEKVRFAFTLAKNLWDTIRKGNK